MFWADELAARFDGPQVVNDSKTPSGTVHIGSLRGVVLHDVIHRALLQAGLPSRFLYGVDDLDPMDSQALLTPDAVERYMGVPLAHVPAPEGSAAESYARYFVGELFMGTFEGLGVAPEVYWMSELYGDGSMDPYIRRALDRAEAIRQIYLRVSNVERAPGWLPVSVICERCGRIGTTLATDWDGETVAYACQPDYVTWASGCGHSGRLAPFGGRAKLPFNVDWAAKWSHFGITIEGCGKDLGTKGGSRDRSNAISREVYDREPPINVHYEFLNVGGRKMSTSKGSGAAAHEMADLLPPELIRFLFLRHKPKKALDFDPGGDAIPGLFDEFDRLAAATAGQPFRGELPADHERIFRLSLVDPGGGHAAGGPSLPAGVPPLDDAGAAARRGPRGARRCREGRAARRGRTGHPRRACRCRPRLAGWLGAGALPGLGPRGPAAGRGRAIGGAGPLPRRSFRRRGGRAPRRRRCLAGPHLPQWAGARCLVARCLRRRLRRTAGPWQRTTRRLAAGKP